MPPAPGSARRCAHVMVVEDDADIRAAIDEVLTDQGYDVVTARDGSEALAILPTLPRPCIVLLDLMMPVMDGWELLRHMKEHDVFATIPVVVVSAVPSSARPAEATGFLKKPVSLEALLAVIREHCG